MASTRGETDTSPSPVPGEHHGGDEVAIGGYESPVLMPVEELVEQFGPPSFSFEEMLQVAIDPSTPDPGDELIPDIDSVRDSADDAGSEGDGVSGSPDLSDLGEVSYSDAEPSSADGLPSLSGETDTVGGEQWGPAQSNPQGHDDYGVSGGAHGYGDYDQATDPNSGINGHSAHRNADEADPFEDEGGIG